jgi:hypothetical protein
MLPGFSLTLNADLDNGVEWGTNEVR